MTPTYNPGETVKLVSGETARVTQRSGQYYIIETQQGNAVAKNTDIAEVVRGAAQDRPHDALSGEGVGAAAGVGTAEEGVANGEGTIAYRQDYDADDVQRIRKEGKTFKNIVANIDTTVSEFFDRWKNGRKSHEGEKLEKLYLGKTTDIANEDISNILGYDVEGRDFIITNDGIRHIFDHHGNNQVEINRGNLPLTKEVIDMLPEIVANPDDVRKGEMGKDGRQGIEFEKRLPDGSVIYIQFDNSGRGTLEGKTLYIKKGL